jgi:hypothetical protein
MAKKPVEKINQEIFISLYREGKSDLELAKLFKVGERTIQRYAAKLRIKHKLKPRNEIVSKTVSVKSPQQLLDIEPLNWKIKPSKRKDSTAKKPFKTIVVSADYHIPYANVPATKAFLQLVADVNPEGFYILGDFMDMEPISHWLKQKKKTLENKRMISDYVEGNRLLDEFDSRLRKDCDKRFWWGNHEHWYSQLIEEMPALEGLLDPTNELKLKERGYKVYEELNHIERVGRLCLVHGMYHSTNYLKAHLDKFQTNVMHADMHSPRFRCSESPAREIALSGYCLGCMTNLSPSYMKNRPNKWSHGFAIVYLFDNGWFDVDIKRIVKGRFVFNGKLYDGNK